MVKEKVTLQDLDDILVGEQKQFVMPNWRKARSAQSFANQQKNYRDDGRTFKAVISPAVEGSQQRIVTITRIA